ncbi:MAG: glycosyltransferase [Cyclobacteriaceae bacterium]
MDDSPFFSIIIPTYNRASVLPDAIRSVLDQKYSNFELIIVDDGSTDETEEVIASFRDKRIRYIQKINEERSIARNTGIYHASGSYVSFLDSDDFLYDNHFSEAYKFISQTDRPEVFHLNFERVYGSKKPNMAESLPHVVNDVVLDDNRLSCNGVFIRRDIANKIKFIHHRRATYTEDTELWIRLSSRYVFHHRPVITSVIQMHDRRSAYIVKPRELLKSFLLI